MTVRIGVVGTSWIAGAFVAAARSVAAVEVAAVCSRSARAAAGFADQHGIPAMYTDLGALGADATVDAVYLATPNSLHTPQAIAMLRAGKHVLVEKPLGANEAQGAAMVAASRETGRVLMEAYVAPFEPNVAALRDALPKVGPLRRVVLVKDQYSSKYDRLKAGTVSNVFDPAFAGGSLMDLGFYPVSLAVHLFGEPVSVLATGIVLASGADGQGTVLLRYDGFEVACLHSKITPTGLGSQVAGEHGVLTFDDCSVPTRVTFTPRLGSPQSPTDPSFTRPAGAAEDLTRPQSPHHMRYELLEFADVVQRGAIESRLHPHGRSLAAAGILDQARAQVGVRFPADG